MQDIDSSIGKNRTQVFLAAPSILITLDSLPILAYLFSYVVGDFKFFCFCMLLHQGCLSDWIISRSVCFCVLIPLFDLFIVPFPPRPSEGALVFFTDPDILDPLGDHNMSSFVGAIPFTRQAAGETKVTFEDVDIVSVLLLS